VNISFAEKLEIELSAVIPVFGPFLQPDFKSLFPLFSNPECLRGRAFEW
jgi:hypothetical protein